MSEHLKPDGQPARKVPAAAMFAAGAAVLTAVTAVAISTNRSPTPADENAPAEIVGTTPADDPTAIIQFGENGQAEPPATPETGAPTSNPDGELTFSDETINFSATFPPGPADDPVLIYLRNDAQAYFRKLKANAVTDAADRKQTGAPAMPWELKIDWRYTAKAGDIVSLVGTAYEFTGGAHGMTHTDTHIARAKTGEQISLDSMLTAGGISPAMVIGVCEALKQEKQKRMGSPTIFDEPIVCAGTNTNIKIEEAKFALAPSSDANKFGGLFVYYEPYAVGAYAEGGYELKLANEVFLEDLRPEYKALFGGKLTGEP